MPSVRGVDAKICVQTRPLIVRRVDGHEINRNAIVKDRVAVAILIRACMVRPEAVLDAGFNLMRAIDVADRTGEERPAGLVVQIILSSKIAPQSADISCGCFGIPRLSSWR